MKEENIVVGRKAGFRSAAFVSALVIGIMVAWATMPHPMLDVDEKGWHILFDGNLAQAAEGNPGAGVGGILWIGFVNHSNPNEYADVAYNTTATLESWCTSNGLAYANADDFNLEMSHSVLFDIVIKVRLNQTECWDGSQWVDTWARMNITSADLGIGADTAMEKFVLHNDTADGYLWLMFYYDFTNAGYDLSKDQSADITSIKLSAYY